MSDLAPEVPLGGTAVDLRPRHTAAPVLLDSSLGLMLVLGAATLWGTTGTASMLIPEGTSIAPQTFGFFRLIIGAPILICAVLLTSNVSWTSFERRHLPLTALFGAMVALYQIGFFFSVKYVGITVGTLVSTGTTPIFAAVLAVLLLRERLSYALVLALLTAIVGTVCFIGLPTDTVPGTDLSLLGIGCGLVAGAAFAVVTITGRVLARRSAPPMIFTAVGFMVGASILLPFASGECVEVLSNWHLWPVLLYLGAASTALAYILYVSGIRRVRTATAGAAATLAEPGIATFLAFAVVGERLQALDWMGAMLLLAALILLLYSEASATSSPGE